MKTLETNWYVITGGPSSGKSTVIRALQDLGYKTTVEAARHYIDLQRMNGRTTEEIRLHQREFQHKVLNLQINIEKKLDPKEIIFFDRALPDEVAYYKYFNLVPDEKLVEYLKYANYKKIFIMDLLPLDPDYARTEDQTAQIKLHQLLIDVYKKRGEPIVIVPVLPIKDRVKFILEHMD